MRAGRPPHRPARARDAVVCLLTLLTGSVDAMSFVSLGGVFTSVMTGNMILVGIGAGRGDTVLLVQVGLAFGAYVLGALAGGLLAGRPLPDDPVWPRAVTAALLVELVLLAGAAALWWSTGSSPGPGGRPVLLAVLAVALGVQSSAVLRLGVPGLSTTYLTGTLTTIINTLAVRRTLSGTARPALVLASLVAGALAGGVSATRAPVLAPALPLALMLLAVATVLALRLHRTRA